ncbi:MAG TPA: hypothetical protein VIL46_02135 [Gemmataceae bacterium]
MRPLTMLRISPAVWCGPFLLAVVLMLVRSSLSEVTDVYGPALTAKGTLAVLILAPACAAGAAWEGGRLRRAGWMGQPHVRSRLTVALVAVAPVLAVGLAVQAAAVAVPLAASGAGPDVPLALLAPGVIAAHTLLGFALGTLLPTAVAAPAALLGVYAWMAVPPALEPLWLRHLTGYVDGCCAADEVPAPRALAGALIVAGGVAGTAALLLRARPRPAGRLLALLPVALALAAGASLVRGMGPDPVADRSGPLACAPGQPRVCMWPEHRARLAEVAGVAAEAGRAWRQLGIVLPREFSERRPGRLPPGVVSFGISQTAPRETVYLELANSLLRASVPACASGDPEYQGWEAMDYLTAWLASAAGLDSEALDHRYGSNPELVRTVRAVRALPAERQRAWAARNLAAVRACGVPPRLEPGP